MNFDFFFLHAPCSTSRLPPFITTLDNFPHFKGSYDCYSIYLSLLPVFFFHCLFYNHSTMKIFSFLMKLQQNIFFISTFNAWITPGYVLFIPWFGLMVPHGPVHFWWQVPFVTQDIKDMISFCLYTFLSALLSLSIIILFVCYIM